LTVFIFPKILPVFKTLNVELPATTKTLIAISNLLTNYGPAVVAGLAIFLVAFWAILKVNKVRYYFHWFILLVPIFGRIFRDVNLANFTRTLGLTLKSGVKVVEALNITAESLSNLVYKKQILKVAEEVSKGEALAPFFATKPRLFPSILSQMISVGEASGNLSETLLYLSDFYEGEVNDITKNLSNVLEPILMVLMGVIVGFVAISIITPIYEVTQTIGRR
jgi:type IV pilus assembly protein PilC